MTVIDLATGQPVAEGLQHDAAQVVRIRDATIRECQRRLRYHAECLIGVSLEAARQYLDAANLLEELRR